MKKYIIQILGPTGAGKSSVAVALAQRINGEIISADSMQVYKDFNIGTDKITKEKMQDIPHHLIDILDDSSQFNTSIFLEKSFPIAEQITASGKTPIVCGGTGLYLKIMINGIFPESDRKRISRDTLKRIAEEKGMLYLWERLNRVDPVYALKIGQNDKVRLVRGLEIYYNNGKTPTEIFKEAHSPFHQYSFIRIGLNMDRDKLYKRINIRVDKMIESGLQAEVETLMKKYPPHCPPFKSLGYKEMLMYLQDELSFDEAVNLIKQHSRNFAKRQLSWFRQEKSINWFNPARVEDIENFVLQKINE
ncbi:MAG: tRNA (adenosine(37)-N6)-dimethylallyltransferase MiaA [bacterium]|nr:tRNA (adenosine(37)-N6)-dimethylallyltransferase MiaA [bacterium]